MEDRLKGRDWLAGEYSYADIAFFTAALFGERMSDSLGGDSPRLLRWRERCAARPAVRAGVAPLRKHLLDAGRPVPEFLM